MFFLTSIILMEIILFILKINLIIFFSILILFFILHWFELNAFINRKYHSWNVHLREFYYITLLLLYLFNIYKQNRIHNICNGTYRIFRTAYRDAYRCWKISSRANVSKIFFGPSVSHIKERPWYKSGGRQRKVIFVQTKRPK